MAQERQAQCEGQQDASTEAFMDLMARARTVFRALPIPAMAQRMLGSAIGHYPGPYTTQTLFAKTFAALRSHGVEGVAQELERLGVKLETSHRTA